LAISTRRKVKKSAAALSVEEKLHLIWSLIRRIPRGKVATYGDIAEASGIPMNPRLVGFALRKAPPGMNLPWQRVLGAGGRISLPGQAALDQRFRLVAEGVKFSGRKVRMDLHQHQF
jgi:methylated-DNA-protein-cysteine methyltransferase-like protein